MKKVILILALSVFLFSCVPCVLDHGSLMSRRVFIFKGEDNK